MTVAVDVGLNWIESTLSGDATLSGYAPGNVFQTFPLVGATAPYKIVKYLNGISVPKFGGISYSDMHFQVTVAGPVDDLQNIQNAAARISVLLTVTQQTAVSGGTLMSSLPDQPVSDDEWVDGQKWHVEGSEFRVMAQSS